jgi:hypothetical protein
MSKVYQAFVFLSILAVSFLFNPTLYAAEGLKIGDTDAEIVPWGEITLQYDDNIFLEPSKRKDDFIITLTPGVSLKWPFSDNRLMLDYHASYSKYLDYSSQDAINHYLFGNLQLKWRDVSFTIYDSFQHAFERPSTEDSSRVKRDDNRGGIKALYQMERLGVHLGYEHFVRNYKSDLAYEPYDRKEHIYSFMLTHRTFPKTDLLFEYDFRQVRYDESSVRSDSDYHQFLIGAIGELTPKTTATIKTGYMTSDYEIDDRPGFDTGVLYAEVIHKFSDKNALKLSALRSAEESTYGGNDFYKIENISATFDHYFTNKLMGFLTGLYQINSYPTETTEDTETKKRKDNYSSLGAGLRYYIKEWLACTFRVDHIMRDSNFSVYDYEQNLVTLSARAEF